VKKVGIVGAGIGGLAASVRLAVQGFEVEVFEALPGPGGKLDSIAGGGYRFDKGPSLFTVPRLVEDLFALAGRDIEPYFRYRTIPEACRYFWDDRTRLIASASIDQFDADVARVLGEDRGAVAAYLDQSRTLYEQTRPLFLERSLHKLSTYLSPEVFGALGALGSVRWDLSLHKVNQKRFKNPKTVQLFDRFATYNGSNPYQTPSVMQIIPHLEHGIGTFLPLGGMQAIPQAIHRLAVDLGVRFRFNCPVSSIQVEHNRAVALVLETGERIGFESVLSNADVYTTYDKLLPEFKLPGRIERAERSSSAVIFYWGMKARFDELGLHNIFFSNDYSAEFNSIFKRKELGNDPTIYVNIGSKFEPGDAPVDSENWFVMVNSPASYGQNWESEVALLRKRVIDRLSAVLGRPIEELIEFEEQVHPLQIEQWTRSHRGALYGTASNDLFSAFLRHPNSSKRLKNLYFCGGSVHPGGGIPLCLLSAKIATDQIVSDVR